MQNLLESLRLRLLLSFGGIILSIILVVGIYSYRVASKSLEDSIKKELQATMQEEALRMLNFTRSVEADLHVLKNMPPLQGIIRATQNNGVDPRDGSTLEHWKNRLSSIFHNVAEKKDVYMQILYIDKHGMETVRVDSEKGFASIAPPERLLNKSNNNYFQQTRLLNDGDTYVSPLNLNREKGEIEHPFRPVMRFATPLYDENSQSFEGVVALNVFAQFALDPLKQIKEHKVYLINKEGYYLEHPDVSKKWGFELNREIRVQKDYPTVFSEVLAGKRGIVNVDENTLLAYFPVPVNERFGIHWTYLVEVDRNAILAPVQTLKNGLLIGTIVLLFIGFLVAFFIATGLLKQIGGEPVRIGELARQVAQGNIQLDFSKTSEPSTGIYAALQDMVRALESKVQLAQQIAAGDLPTKVPLASEKDVLGKALQEMVDTLNTTTEVAVAVSQGDYSRPVEVKGKNDLLGNAIQTMFAHLQQTTAANETEDWLKTGQSILNDTIRGEQTPAELTEKVLRVLAEYIHAQVGVFYLQKDERYYLESGYAYTVPSINEKYYQTGEGLIGQAALEKKVLLFDHDTEDMTDMVIDTGMGMIKPKAILVFPLVFDTQVLGVIGLGKIRQYTKTELELIERVSESIAIAINTAHSRLQMQKLLEATQTQATALKSQQEQLQAKTLALEAQQEATKSKNEELQKAQQELEEKARALETSSQYKSEFLANMSHELRTPLNSLLLFAESLVNNEKGNLSKEQVQYAKAIFTSGNELLELINEVLDLSKVEAGKMTITQEAVSLQEVMDYVQLNFEHLAQEKGLSFHIQMEEKRFTHIQTDQQKLKQILKNLLSNAFKFTSQGKVVFEIVTPTRKELHRTKLSPDQTIAFIVSDTGIGIPASEQEQIFDAFQQVNGGISRNYGGTGLGLSITREFVSLLGGIIRLDSQEKRGSTFTFYLPANIEPASASLQSPFIAVHRESIGLSSDIPNKFNGQTVMIVDDDARNTFALTPILEAKGLHVVQAFDGQECLANLEKYEAVDLILMDIMMPVMDGYQAMREIRQLKEFEHLPIIALTAKAMAEDRDKCIEAGADDYLSKPLDTTKLLCLLKVWLHT